MEISELVERQRRFYHKHQTLSYEFRKSQLLKLRQGILNYQERIEEALYQDLGKSAIESYISEIGLTLKEIRYLINNLKKLMKKKRVRTAISDFPAKSYRSPHPYGVALIMSPWNYPILLTLSPLAGAIASGNTAILKPSNYSFHTSAVLEEMIKEIFSEDYVSVITGGRDANQSLLEQKFDYIFFTGGKAVGKIVMEKAAKNLTPVSLELGGKSPCIVSKSANLQLAAKRIVFGKFLNVGQTCIAPDYLFVQESIKDEFVKQLKLAIIDKYDGDPLNHEFLGKIINERHFMRLNDLLKEQKILHGGSSDKQKQQIEPTVIDIETDNIIMEDEIFGPILPLVSYKELNEVINYINDNPNPLALYLFSTDKPTQEKVLDECNFGGGCINDTIVHVASDHLPFGGVGESGMGAYHGKASFDTFTHYRSIVHKHNAIDLPIRYSPYTKFKRFLIKLFLR